MNKSKSINWKKIKHFSKSEFKCSCCSKVLVSRKLVLMLDLAREIASVPFNISDIVVIKSCDFTFSILIGMENPLSQI